MRVALVHDWITGLRGGEKCLLDFLSIYPDADVYTLFYKSGTTDKKIDERVVGTSLLQKLPLAVSHYKAFLPLYPLAASSLKLKGYDLVISLSHAAAKNVKILDDAYHISYCFTPMRYIWDLAPQYFGKVLPLALPLVYALRHWDRQASQRVNAFVGISSFIAARIRCFYGRRAEVIYPAVNTDWITPCDTSKRGDFFLYAGANVPYKRVDVVVAACSKLGLPLYVANEPTKALQNLAGPSVKFLGKPSNQELAELYRRCRALVFPAKEDFGMVPVECMAAGRPVVGLYAGGLKETLSGVKHWQLKDKSHLMVKTLATASPTGVFIQDRCDLLQATMEALTYFQQVEGQFEVGACVKRAKMFAHERFFASWQALIDKAFNNRVNL